MRNTQRVKWNAEADLASVTMVVDDYVIDNTRGDDAAHCAFAFVGAKALQQALAFSTWRLVGPNGGTIKVNDDWVRFTLTNDGDGRRVDVRAETPLKVYQWFTAFDLYKKGEADRPKAIRVTVKGWKATEVVRKASSGDHTKHTYGNSGVCTHPTCDKVRTHRRRSDYGSKRIRTMPEWLANV